MAGLWIFDAALVFSVFIHEAGHALMALVLGVRIERFRYGFGPRLMGAGIFEIRLVPVSGEVQTEKGMTPWKGAFIALGGVLLQWLVMMAATLTGIAQAHVVFWAWVLGLAMLSLLNLIPIGATDGAVTLRWAKNSHRTSIS